jgi:hypothetical protein
MIILNFMILFKIKSDLKNKSVGAFHA